MRGNPDNLRQAATRKSVAAQARAEQGLRGMIRNGQPITFRGLAQAAGVSLDFLYRNTEIPGASNSYGLNSRTPRPRRRARHRMTAPAVSCAPSPRNWPHSSNNTAPRPSTCDRPWKPPTARSSNYAANSATPRSSTPAEADQFFYGRVRKRSTSGNTLTQDHFSG